MDGHVTRLVRRVIQREFRSRFLQNCFKRVAFVQQELGENWKKYSNFCIVKKYAINTPYDILISILNFRAIYTYYIRISNRKAVWN